MDQVVQVVGSLLVLAAFAASQAGRLDPRSRRYLVLNLVGSGTLAVQAAMTSQWGFLLLEGVWALVSFVGLVKPRRSASTD
jgi:hypothetical protein